MLSFKVEQLKARDPFAPQTCPTTELIYYIHLWEKLKGNRGVELRQCPVGLSAEPIETSVNVLVAPYSMEIVAPLVLDGPFAGLLAVHHYYGNLIPRRGLMNHPRGFSPKRAYESIGRNLGVSPFAPVLTELINVLEMPAPVREARLTSFKADIGSWTTHDRVFNFPELIADMTRMAGFSVGNRFLPNIAEYNAANEVLIATI